MLPFLSPAPAHLPALLRDSFALQRAAFQQQRNPSVDERRADLRQLHRLLVEHRAAIVDAVQQDYGCRSRFETLLTELLQGQEAALAALRHLKRWMRPQQRRLDMLQYPLARAYTFAQPLGVVGIVVPWNFPVAMAFQPLIGAFAAGNRAMVKMSENSGHLARLLQRISPQYFPADKLCFFADDDAGPGQSLGPLFTQLPFDHLFFTGSPQTGQAVMANAAIHLTPVTLELGGKSPAIVAPDFALDQAAERLLWAKLLNAGQICTNVDYLLLPEGREQAFIEHARRIAAARFPNLLNGDYTAIIDQRQYDRLQAMLQDAQAQGATLIPLLPGQAGDAARRILPPVLVLNATPAMQVLQREIFGPILPILTYRSHEEVVQYINARQHPLALYIYSHDKAVQDFYLHHTLSGGVSINDSLIHTGLHNLPFGGVGHRSCLGQHPCGFVIPGTFQPRPQHGREILRRPVAVIRHLRLRTAGLQGLEVEVGDRPGLAAAGLHQHAVGRQAHVHRRDQRGLAGIAVQRRAPRCLAGSDCLRDEAAVLQRPRQATHAHPGRAGVGVRATRHQQQPRTGLALRAHRQREFAVVADRDARAHAAGIEHLQGITGVDHPGALLEAGQAQFVLPQVATIDGEEIAAVAIAPAATVEQETAGDDRHAKPSRQSRIQRQPVVAQRLDRRQRCMQVAAGRCVEHRRQFQRQVFRQHRQLRAARLRFAEQRFLFRGERGEIAWLADRVFAGCDFHARVSSSNGRSQTSVDGRCRRRFSE